MTSSALGDTLKLILRFIVKVFFFIIVDVVRPSLSLSAEQGADLTLLFNT